MATQDFQPQSGHGGGNTTCDSYIYRGSVDETWATIIAGVGSVASPTSANLNVEIVSNATSTHYSYLLRNILTINVSGFLGNPANITGITMNFYVSALSGDFGTFISALSLVDSSPTANNDVVVGDFVHLGTTRYASDIPKASVAVGWIQFTLNATGITAVKAAIAGAGILKLGLRAKEDLDGTTPTWASGKDDDCTINSADAGSNNPYLEITYTAGTVYTMVTAPASYTFTPQSSGDKTVRKIITSPASFALTGMSSGFKRVIHLITAPASYVLTGLPATFLLKKSWIKRIPPTPYLTWAGTKGKTFLQYLNFTWLQFVSLWGKRIEVSGLTWIKRTVPVPSITWVATNGKTFQNYLSSNWLNFVSIWKKRTI